MPSSATITSYVTLVPGTKARASDVNSIFQNYRGHIVPVNTDTATASHETHDLGASDHEWRTVYLHKSPKISNLHVGVMEVPILLDGSVGVDTVLDASWLTRAGMPKDKDTAVVFQFIVPRWYTPGSRISLGVSGYLETFGSKHITLESRSALFKPGITDASLTSPANVLTSTSNILGTTTGRLFSDTTLRLTDSNGLINSLTVTADDLIAVDLRRKGTALGDTNGGYFYLTDVVVDLDN